MNFRDRHPTYKLLYSQFSTPLFLFFFATTRRRAVKTEIMREKRTLSDDRREWMRVRVSIVLCPFGSSMVTDHAIRFGKCLLLKCSARPRVVSFGATGDIGDRRERIGRRLGWWDRTESVQEVSEPDVKFSNSLSCNRRSPKKSKTNYSNLWQYVGRHHRGNEFQAQRL